MLLVNCSRIQCNFSNRFEIHQRNPLIPYAKYDGHQFYIVLHLQVAITDGVITIPRPPE